MEGGGVGGHCGESVGKIGVVEMIPPRETLLFLLWYCGKVFSGMERRVGA